MSKEKIWLSSPHMSGHEQAFVQNAFDTNWVAPLGPNVDGFEGDIQSYTGIEHAAVLNSGTAAIHLALIILGVQQGDDVLVSSFTFSGSINPIIYLGATPIMVESEPDTWNMSPEFLEEAIKERIKKKGKPPKAVIIVDLYGMPAQLDELLRICRSYGIQVIEDAAEALGGSYKGRKLGTFGDIGVYSFNGNKIITTSGGGALVSNNEEWVRKAKFLSTQARDAAIHYEHSEIGYNYRMSNLIAGVGRGQMLVLDEWVKRRRNINQLYREWLSSAEGITLLTEPSTDYFSNYWLTTIHIDDSKSSIKRDDIQSGLENENIESRPLWKPMHMQPAYKQYPYFGDGLSEELFSHGLCLPSGSNLTDKQLDRIQDCIFRILKEQ